MSFKKRLRTIFMCAALELGVLSGVPMRPEEIRALMNQINQPKLAHVLPADEQDGDEPPVLTSLLDFLLEARQEQTIVDHPGTARTSSGSIPLACPCLLSPRRASPLSGVGSGRSVPRTLQHP